MEPGRPESRAISDVVPDTHASRVWPCVRVSWAKSEISLGLMSSLISKNRTPSTETKLLVFVSKERHYLSAAFWTEITTKGHKSFSKSLECGVIWWKPCITWSHLCHGKCGHQGINILYVFYPYCAVSLPLLKCNPCGTLWESRARTELEKSKQEKNCITGSFIKVVYGYEWQGWV